MTNLVKLSAAYGALTNAFVTADLDGLTTGSYKFGSTVIDNTTNLDLQMDVIVNLGSFNPSGTPYITLSVLTSMDGSNYEDPQAAAAPLAGTPTYSHVVTTGASAKVVVFRGIQLPPGKSKLMLGNITGATFATGGNTVKCWTYSLTDNG